MATRTGYEIPFLMAYDDTTSAQHTFSIASLTVAKTVTVPNADVNLTFLGDIVAGTAVANRAVVLDGSLQIDTISVALSGLKIAGTAITASAAEVNYNTGVVAGTATANKTLVLGATKNVDTIDVTDGGFKLSGTAVSSTAAELNFNDGSIAGTAVANKTLVLGATKNVDVLTVDGTLTADTLAVTNFIGVVQRVTVVVTQADLAGGGSKILIDSTGARQYEIMDVEIIGGGTDFSGGGGDRKISIQDASATHLYSLMPKTALTSLTTSRWGQSNDMPYPATPAHMFQATDAGSDLVAKYSAGTADYTAGSTTFRVTYIRTV